MNAVNFPGQPGDDGGLPGVSVTWLNHAGGRFWYAFASEEAFWRDIRFATAVDDQQTRVEDR